MRAKAVTTGLVPSQLLPSAEPEPIVAAPGLPLRYRPLLQVPLLRFRPREAEGGVLWWKRSA